MNLKVKTLECSDCDREITGEEWDTYVGERRVLLEIPDSAPYFHCGCKGGEKRVGVLILADVVCNHPMYTGTAHIGEKG